MPVLTVEDSEQQIKLTVTVEVVQAVAVDEHILERIVLLGENCVLGVVQGIISKESVVKPRTIMSV